ncbi:hypothetical protein ACVWWS_001737 [Pseudomonas chlororaphis]
MPSPRQCSLRATIAGGTPGAVGDRAADVRRPDRRPVLADRRNAVQAVQALQGGAGAETPGEKLGLPFRHRTLNARGRLDGAELEVVAGQARGIEMGAEQDDVRQGVGQRPLVVEWGAAGGEGGDEIHARHFAGL